EFFNGEVVVGVNTDVSCNAQTFFNNFSGTQIGVFQQGAGRGLGIRPAGAYGNQVILRLNDVTVTGDDQGCLSVGHCQQSLESPQGAVGAPVFGQLDGGAGEVAAMALELGFKTFEEGKSIGGATGKTSQNLIPVQ